MTRPCESVRIVCKNNVTKQTRAGATGGGFGSPVTSRSQAREAPRQWHLRAYQVQYRDAESGAITRIETFRNRWQRVGKLDLPESITQTVSSAGGVSVRSLKLQSLKLAEDLSVVQEK